MPVKLGFIILSLIGVLRIPEEFYLYKDKDKDKDKVTGTDWKGSCKYNNHTIMTTAAPISSKIIEHNTDHDI